MSKEKSLLSWRKFFPLRIDPFQKELSVKKSKQKVNNVVFLVKKRTETPLSVPSPLNPCLAESYATPTCYFQPIRLLDLDYCYKFT